MSPSDGPLNQPSKTYKKSQVDNNNSWWFDHDGLGWIFSQEVFEKCHSLAGNERSQRFTKSYTIDDHDGSCIQGWHGGS